MADISDEKKIEMASAAAKVAFQTMVGCTGDIQFEASIILLRSLFLANVKPTHRISLFNSVVQRLRHELKDYGKEQK